MVCLDFYHFFETIFYKFNRTGALIYHIPLTLLSQCYSLFCITPNHFRFPDEVFFLQLKETHMCLNYCIIIFDIMVSVRI